MKFQATEMSSFLTEFLQGHMSWAITVDLKAGAHIICRRLTCILSPKHTPLITEDRQVQLQLEN